MVVFEACVNLINEFFGIIGMGRYQRGTFGFRVITCMLPVIHGIMGLFHTVLFKANSFSG